MDQMVDLPDSWFTERLQGLSPKGRLVLACLLESLSSVKEGLLYLGITELPHYNPIALKLDVSLKGDTVFDLSTLKKRLSPLQQDMVYPWGDAGYAVLIRLVDAVKG